MTKPQLIELIKLLSALESWGFSDKHTLPPYLADKLDEQLEIVTNEVLK